MAIDKRILPDIADDDPRQEALVVNIAEDEIGSNVSMMEDGSAIIGDVSEPMEESFDSNLAEFIDEQELNIISSELLEKYQQDRSSRDKWENAYRKGLDLLGFQYNERSQPFQGASGVTHPLLAESVTQFQAQGYKELLPAGGPVSTQIIGKSDPAKEEQAERVKEFMNYQITHVMEEYDPELDQMLFHLPLAGSAFKKVYYDAGLQRAVSKFISADDLVVPYSATDLTSCERITHIVKMSENEVRKQQVAGFYRDIDLEYTEKEDRILEKERDIEGVQKVGQEDEYTLLEIHVDLNIPGVDEDDGIKVPYIVTIDEGTSEVLSVYRNYKEDDPIKKKNKYFVHYKFLPGLGFYGFGLIHMLGGLSRTATAALRQLIDAGTLSNLPAGFKARGLRIADDDSPLQPGEFRDVDAPSGDLRAGLMPLPYKEPSPTLFQLLGFVVEAGTRFATVADQKIGDSVAANAPVGTTMALMERGTKVMSAIHKRLHYAQKTEFQILAKLFKESLAPGYPYKPAGQQGFEMVKQQDFDDRIDVLPVSDPNIFSMAQRMSLAQTQLQMAQANPEIHNIREAYRRMYEALEVKNVDALLPAEPQPQPLDPAGELAAIMTGKKIVAVPGQNHMAHIQSHLTVLQSPKMMEAPAISAPLMTNIFERLSLIAQEEIQQQVAQQQQAMMMQGIQPPQIDPQQLMPMVEQRTAELVGQVMPQLTPQDSDPLVGIRQTELQIQAADQERKAQKDQVDAMLEQARLEQQSNLARERLQATLDIAGERNNVNRERIETQEDIAVMREMNKRRQ